METYTMLQQVEWSTVLVDCGEQCATISGVKLMLTLCVDS